MRLPFQMASSSTVLFFKMIASDHPRIPQRFFDCLFPLRRTFGLLGILRLWLIVILPLNNSAFLLHLSEIQSADLKSGMLHHIIINLLIGSLFIRISQIQLSIFTSASIWCSKFSLDKRHTVSTSPPILLINNTPLSPS